MCLVVHVQYMCVLWCLKLGLALWSCPVDVAWVGAPSQCDLWPFATPSISLAGAFQSVSGGPRWGEVVSVWKVIVWKWTCSTHTVGELCGCGGGVMECHQHHFGVDQYCGLPVGFWWSVKISKRNRIVLLWVCSVPSFWPIEYIKCTLLVTIEWEWLVIFYVMDVCSSTHLVTVASQ